MASVGGVGDERDRETTLAAILGCRCAAAVALMDLAGIAKLPEPDFTARVQAGQLHVGQLDLGPAPGWSPPLRK